MACGKGLRGGRPERDDALQCSCAIWLCCARCLAACARSNASDDARPGDARIAFDAAVDGGPPRVDLDAGVPRPGAEVVSAGGRIRSGSVTMDVEIGHWVDQGRATAGTRALEGAAVVNP